MCCDLYPEMVEFCVKTFGVSGATSKEDLSQLRFAEPFDLIWSGSLLTHLDTYLFHAAFDLLRRSLSKEGVAICTLHGRQVLHLQHNVWKMCDDSLFAPAETDMKSTGFGFIDTHDERSQEVHYLNKDFGGGHSLSMPSYVIKILENFNDVSICLYREAGWNWHQDVVAFCKPGILSQG